MGTTAEATKTTKYAELARTHHVTHLTIKTSGVLGEELYESFTKLSRWIIRITGDSLTRCHMIQQISVTLGNAASVLGHCRPIHSF